MFTVWLPGNTGPCWKKAADRKSRASVQHGRHVAPPPLFEKLKVLAMKCVRALFMALPLRDVQYVQRVTAKPVCVGGFVCTNAEPRAAYVYVRVTATHRDAESERCVCHHQTAATASFKLNHKLRQRDNLTEVWQFCFSHSWKAEWGGFRIRF